MESHAFLNARYLSLRSFGGVKKGIASDSMSKSIVLSERDVVDRTIMTAISNILLGAVYLRIS